MMVRTLASVAQHVNGRLIGPDCRFDHVTTDTRAQVRGSLFVALRGEHFDGNDYIAAAGALGAAGALVSRRAEVPLSQIEVADTRLAFGAMARAWRRTFNVPVVAVTGSAGKTTVRSLIASILSADRQICTTEGNLNNDIGVPITLMRMQRGDAAAVIELGANHAGEIDYLAAIAQPDVALITNAGSAHLEGFGSRDGIAAAKGELLDHLSDGGTAILNADDRYFEQWSARAQRCRILSFGFGFSSDCHVVNEIDAHPGGSRFTAHLPDGRHVPIALPLPGRHNVQNALAAAAAAFALGVSGEQIAFGLHAARPVNGRLRELAGIAGARIIDDSYNANPASTRAALDYLAEFEGQRVFVLGDMGELGAETVSLHREVGEYARDKCDRFVAIGPLAGESASAFGNDAEVFNDVAEVAARLRGDLTASTTVLIKASRAMHLERLAAALAGAAEEPAC
jgi:UDP-N-acetylmuramoyl-tripeptide--D-alanyl-D-alanine ligase